MKSSSSTRIYHYQGRHLGSTQTVSGELMAKNAQQAKLLLRRQGILTLKIKKCRSQKVNVHDIAVLTRQFAMMVKSSLPLLQIFDLLEKSQEKSALRAVLASIRQQVAQGQSLAQAFAKYPQYFDRFYCGVLAAGETGGVLDQVLENLADTLTQNAKLKRQVQKAAIYPVSVLLIASLLILVMMMFVLPEFEQVYRTAGVALPWLTQSLMNIAQVMPYLLPLFLGLSVLATWIARRQYTHNYRFRLLIHRFLLHLPLMGKVVRESTQARILRTSAVLFAAGVPLPDALSASGGVCGNAVYEQAVQNIRRRIIQGNALTLAMQESGVFDHLAVQMVAVGEESGTLDAMLLQTAQLQENETSHRIEILTSLLEPMLMLVLGVLVGILLLALYLPLFQLGNVLG